MTMALHDDISLIKYSRQSESNNSTSSICSPVYTAVFEDKSGPLELARLQRLHPKTQVNLCYHHFMEHVQRGIIKISPMNRDDQIAYTLSKGLM